MKYSSFIFHFGIDYIDGNILSKILTDNVCLSCRVQEIDQTFRFGIVRCNQSARYKKTWVLIRTKYILDPNNGFVKNKLT